MSRNIPSSSITVSISTRRALLPARMVQQVAIQVGVDSLDVDATSALGAWLAARLATADDTYVPVSTMWLPGGELRSPRSRRFMEKIAGLQPDVSPCVIATLPAGATLHELTNVLELGGGLRATDRARRASSSRSIGWDQAIR